MKVITSNPIVSSVSDDFKRQMALGEGEGEYDTSGGGSWSGTHLNMDGDDEDYDDEDYDDEDYEGFDDEYDDEDFEDFDDLEDEELSLQEDFEDFEDFDDGDEDEDEDLEDYEFFADDEDFSEARGRRKKRRAKRKAKRQARRAKMKAKRTKRKEKRQAIRQLPKGERKQARKDWMKKRRSKRQERRKAVFQKRKNMSPDERKAFRKARRKKIGRGAKKVGRFHPAVATARFARNKWRKRRNRSNMDGSDIDMDMMDGEGMGEYDTAGGGSYDESNSGFDSDGIDDSQFRLEMSEGEGMGEYDTAGGGSNFYGADGVSEGGEVQDNFTKKDIGVNGMSVSTENPVFYDSDMQEHEYLSSACGEEHSNLFGSKANRRAKRTRRQGARRKKGSFIDRTSAGFNKLQNSGILASAGNLLGGNQQQGTGIDDPMMSDINNFQPTKPPKSGMSTGAKIGIGVGVVALLGVGAYFLMKKK